MILKNDIFIEDKLFSEKMLNDGLSIYEVFRVYKGKVIFLNDNILRLANSIKKSNKTIDISELSIKERLYKLIEETKLYEGNIKYVLHFTDHNCDEYIYTIPHTYPSEEDYHQGVNTVTYKAIRDNAEIKYINSNLRETTNQIIKEKNVYEVLLIDENNFITEGSRSNVFFIKDNTIYTAPLPYVLPGTSRKRVLEICQKEDYHVVETLISYDDISEYESAFITGTSPLVLPLRKIDNVVFDTQNHLLQEIMVKYFYLLDIEF